jgi:hypothetical protein
LPFRIKELLLDAIVPNEQEGETPLLHVLNRYKPIGSTADGGLHDETECPQHAALPCQRRRSGVCSRMKGSERMINDNVGKGEGENGRGKC